MHSCLWIEIPESNTKKCLKHSSNLGDAWVRELILSCLIITSRCLLDTTNAVRPAFPSTYFKPPFKDDEYADVDYDGREMYAQQAQNLWDRLQKVIPASVITKSKSTFAVGKKEVEFSCPEGDGPSLIFSIIALYRPSGDAYRQNVEIKIYASGRIWATVLIRLIGSRKFDP